MPSEEMSIRKTVLGIMAFRIKQTFGLDEPSAGAVMADEGCVGQVPGHAHKKTGG
jgi:hypothetical protein